MGGDAMANVFQKQAMRWARKQVKHAGKAAPRLLDKVREQAAPVLKKAVDRGVAPAELGASP